MYRLIMAYQGALSGVSRPEHWKDIAVRLTDNNQYFKALFLVLFDHFLFISRSIRFRAYFNNVVLDTKLPMFNAIFLILFIPKLYYSRMP